MKTIKYSMNIGPSSLLQLNLMHTKPAD